LTNWTRELKNVKMIKTFSLKLKQKYKKENQGQFVKIREEYEKYVESNLTKKN